MKDKIELNKNIKEILSSEDGLVNEIKRNGFDILEDYKILDSKFENGIIKDIVFELKNNPFDTDYDYNGCIILVFTFKNDKIQCQVQLEATTNNINYSNFVEYNDYHDNEYDIPYFKNETNFGDRFYCRFDNFYNTNDFKTINIFKSITKYMIKANLNIKECINTQQEIDEFESKYYEKVLDINSEGKYDMLFDELTEEEQQEIIYERDGMATYNMMVREGWIDED